MHAGRHEFTYKKVLSGTRGAWGISRMREDFPEGMRVLIRGKATRAHSSGGPAALPLRSSSQPGHSLTWSRHSFACTSASSAGLYKLQSDLACLLSGSQGSKWDLDHTATIKPLDGEDTAQEIVTIYSAR